MKKTLPYVDYAFFSGSGKTIDEIKSLQKDIAGHGPEIVVVTRGAEGAVLYKDGQYTAQPVVPVKVVDTLGAGDGFIAGFLVEYKKNRQY